MEALTARTTDVVCRNGSVLVSIVEVNLRRARLVLGWVTVHAARWKIIKFISNLFSISTNSISNL